MPRDLARQRQQRERLLQRHVAGRETLRQRAALRLLALAELHVIAEAAAAPRHFLAAAGIDAEHRHPRPLALGAVLAVRRQHAGVFALGIVRAADEGAELAELQRKLAGGAGGAGARIAAVGLGGENMRTEEFVEAVEHLARAQVLDLAERGGELAPEVAEQILPVDLAVGDPVEPLLQVGGEVVFDITAEERLEERRHQPSLVLRARAASSPAAHIRGRAAPRASRRRSRAGRCRAPPCA